MSDHRDPQAIPGRADGTGRAFTFPAPLACGRGAAR